MIERINKACIKCFLIIITMGLFTEVSATSYNISIFNGGGASNNALINRLTPFVSGDILNIQNNITSTSSIGNIGSFPLTINGNSNALNGGAVPTFAGFSMTSAADYSFSSLDLNNFKTSTTAAGGAITNAGTLSFLNGDFNDNSGVNAGGIYNTGNATVTGTIAGSGPTATSTTTFYNNSSVSGNGGGIYTNGTSTLTGIKFDSNHANGTGTTAGGGAIYTAIGTTTIDGSIFTSNTAIRNGGGIYQASGTLNITGSLFDSNSANNALTSTALGGAIYSVLGSTLNLTNTDFTNNSSKTNGGAIWNRAVTTIIGGTFSGNDSSIGGAIYSNANSSVTGATFSNNEANTTLANSGGGAIYNNVTSFTITDTDFTSNSANSSTVAAYGGAIFNQNGIISLTGTILGSGASATSSSTFDSNTAKTFGGAIYNNATTAGRTLTATGIIFDNNSATSGGAFYNNAGVATFTNNIFKNNSATTSGGAIYNIGTTNVTSGDFLTNSATVSGGALYNTGTSTILNSDFSGNTAGTSGGAIFNSGTLRIQADGQESLFTSNFVGSVANDLHLGGGTVYLNAGNSGQITFDGAITSSAKANTLNINTITGSSSLTNGTVNFNGDISTCTINIASGTTNIGKSSISNVNENNVLFAITGGTQEFTKNTFLNGSRITLNDATPTAGETLNITGSTFNGSGIFSGSGGAINITSGNTNITNTNFSNYNATTGGGAILNGGTTSSTDTEITGTITGSGASATSTTTFSNNTSAGSGGAINNTGTMVLNNIKFDANSSTSTSSTGGGGAIYQAGALTINNGIFTNNTTTARGGAIYGAASATGSIGAGSIFDSNSATGASSSGGAIYALGAPTISGVTFNKNYATVNGGAMYVAGNNVTMLNDTFTDNGKNGAVVETDNGGAIYNDVGNITVTDTTFTNNASTLTGGAIRNAVSSTNSITLNGGTFTGNSSANGGAVYNEGIMYINSGSDVTKFISNIATLNGGAIYGLGGAGVVSSGTFFDSNSAGQDGGAIYTTSTPTYTGATFQNNWAERNGGAVYSATTNTSYTNCTFNNNGKSGATVKTDNGGAIYDANSAMTLTGDTFTGNASSVSGGAVYNTITSSGRTLVGNTLTFTSNSSLNGGAFYNNAGVASLTDTDFTTNSATNNGGAIFSTGGTLTITGNDFTSNTATNFGGAIYNDTSTTTNTSNSTFTSNVASSGGAVYNLGTESFTNSNFIDNGKTGATTTTVNGGAIYNAGGTTTLTDCSFTNNAATTSGGAIYLATGTVNVNATNEDVTFSGNTQAGSVNDIFMVAGSTLALTANNYDILINGGIQGAGTINKLGTGDLVLQSTSVNNLFTGTYNNSAGNVQIKTAFFAGSNNFTGGTAEIQTGGSLSLNLVTLADTWTNTVITNSGGTLNFNGFSHTTGGAYNQSAGTLSLNNTGTASSFSLTSTSNVTGGNIAFSGIGNTLSVLTGGTLSSGVALNLTSGNIFNVSGGTATLNGTGTASDTWAGTINLSSGTLNLNSMTANGIYNQTGGTTNLDSASNLTISNPSDNLSGGSLVANGTLNLSNTVSETVLTSISGNGTVNKNAGGNLTITGNDSNFTGTYNQTAGLVTIQNAFFAGTNNFTGGSVDVDTNGSLTLNTGDTWTGTSILTSGGAFTLDSFSHLTGGTYNQSSGTLHLNNGSYLNLNALNTISGGVVDYEGTGSFLDVQSGGSFSTGATLILTLNTENTFKVSGGTATLSSTDTWGGLGKVDLTSGGLTLNGLTSNGVYNQSGGTLTLTTGATLKLGSNSTISGGIVTYSGTGIKTLDVSTGGTFASNAQIGVTSGNFFKVSGGTATLNGTGTGIDTWAGTVDVSAGTLAVNSITSNGIYTQSGGTTTFSSGSTITLSDTSELGGGSLVNNGILNLSNTSAEIVSTAISGNGTVNKNAVGTSTFSGDNSAFTGTFNLTSDGIVVQNKFFNGVNNFTGASTTASLQTGADLKFNSGDSWTNTNITSSGGSLTLDAFSHTSGGTYNQTAGALQLNNGSSLTLATGNAISGGTVDFSSTGNLLNIASGGSFGSDTALNITNGNTFRVSGGTATLNGSGTGQDVWDGAINLTNGTLTVNNVPHSSGIYGTYSQSNGTVNFINQDLDTSSDIVLTGGTMNINAGNGGSSYLRDKISATGGVVNINKTDGTSPTDGTLYVNASIDPPSEVNLYNGVMALSSESYIDGNNLGLYGGTINTQNSLIGTMALTNLTFGGTANWLMDVNLANATGDKITSTNAVTGLGSLNINGINVLTDANNLLTSVLVADANTRNYLTTSVTEVNGALFKYGVTYDGAGGTLNFTKTGVNPAATTGDIAQTSTFLLQTAIDRQFFGNIESFMSFPLAQRESSICCALNSKVASGQQTGSACPISGNGMFSPIYSCNLNKGIWTKNFVSFEDIPLRNGPRVSTIEYGTLIGVDDVIKKLKYGFVGNTSAFIGYLGSNQNYEGVGVSQNGVMVGLAENMVKNNLFVTLMASVGASLGLSNNRWGEDSFSSLFAGAAVRSGYNFEFQNGEYIVQPNLMLAYTFTNTPAYTTASGLSVDTKPLNAMQVAPGIRLIKNLKEQKGQVYLISNFVYNIMDNTHFTANDVGLPQLSIAPYIEYGIGYQGVWRDRLTCFFQTLLRGGGRNGIAFQFGLRWAF